MDKLYTEQQLRWLSHATRLQGSSAAKALEESERHINRPQGRPQNTWLSCMKGLLRVILTSRGTKRKHLQPIDKMENDNKLL